MLSYLLSTKKEKSNFFVGTEYTVATERCEIDLTVFVTFYIHKNRILFGLFSFWSSAVFVGSRRSGKTQIETYLDTTQPYIVFYTAKKERKCF